MMTTKHERSTKAGTVIPATPAALSSNCVRLREAMHALNEGRDRNPGDTGRPASVSMMRGGISSSLNEGRDRNPGDTAGTFERSRP